MPDAPALSLRLGSLGLHSVIRLARPVRESVLQRLRTARTRMRRQRRHASCRVGDMHMYIASGFVHKRDRHGSCGAQWPWTGLPVECRVRGAAGGAVAATWLAFSPDSDGELLVYVRG